MKIQCTCGAKYAFEVKPEQAQEPVQFVCPACGLDSSEYVTNLVRQELGIVVTPPGVASATEIALPPGQVMVPVPTASDASDPPTRPTTSPAPAPAQLRLHRDAAKATEEAAPAADARFCPKHPGIRTTANCLVCEKPICPRCMELLGYVCSPLCKQKADLKGITIPVFGGQRSVREARKWRVVGWMTAGVSAVLVAALGFWCWYAWFGSRPHVAFALRFEQPAYSGASVLCGRDQIVFLHGGTLARHDLKLKKQIWSVELVDQPAIARQVEQTLKSYHAAQTRLNDTNPDADPIKIPSPEKLTQMAEREAAAMLELRVAGQNIWVGSPGKLVQHDWETGQPGKTLAARGSFRGMIARGDELLMLEEQPGKEIVTHINLATGATREEEILQSDNRATPGGAGQPALAATGARAPRKTGLPVGAAGQDRDRPLDPGKVEQEFSHLPLAGRIASPAVLSANRNQERALAELNGTAGRKPAAAEAGRESADQFVLIPARDGYVQFSTRLIEQRLVVHQAMKAPPKKSALNGPVNMAATTDVANEILNEMQRDRGGATVLEDESRYQVTVRRVDGKSPWTVEVIGPPSLFPLKSVNVIAANKKLIVLDQNNQKLWESPLSYNVVGGALGAEVTTGGEGPCVERGNTLYVFDQGVLTAFDLKTGNAQWRLPSVGISSLFFDEQGMLYVNSTTAGPESIKYSRQIDVAVKSSGVILKVDPRSGKILWQRESPGPLAYLSGQYIYTLQSFGSYEDAEDGSPYVVQTGMETQPFVRIKRINPRNGRDLWEHFQPRAPLDVRFDQNTIHLVFRKEVQVLKYLSL